MFDFLRKAPVEAVPERKASAVGRVIAWGNAGRVAWSPRDTSSLTRTGFQGNPVGFRVVRPIAEAQIVAPDTYDLSNRLRGQLGTDGIMPSVWPVGSTVVLLDLALTQIDIASSSRGLVRHYRIGVASRGFEDTNVIHRVEAFDGIGLRPYPVSHLRSVDQAGDLQISWKRRTRIDGDTWQSPEVPLGEDSEAYQVRVIQASAIVAEYSVNQPQFLYTTAMRSLDGISGSFEIAVAQLSSSFGPGPFRKIVLAG